MNILLIANGKVNNKILNLNFVKEKKIDKIIAVNGGTNKLIKLNILPDIIIGDLDSKKIRKKQRIRKKQEKKIEEKLTNEIQWIETITFPKDKDYSDLELAINYINANLSQNNFNQDRIIYCFGVIGNRLDHTLANINSLFNLYLKNNFNSRVIIYDLSSVLFLIKNEDMLELKTGVNIRASVLSFSLPFSKVILDGFKYQGEYEIPFMSSLGISNLTISNLVKITSISGKVVFILYSFDYVINDN